MPSVDRSSASLLVASAVRPRYGDVRCQRPGLLAQALRKAGRMDLVLLYYREHLLHVPEFADLMTAMTAETRSTRLVGQITTVTRPRCCSRSPIRNKMCPSTYVSSDPSPRALFCSDTDGRQDRYLNVPIDLTQILFICTANSLNTISPPLLDR